MGSVAELLGMDRTTLTAAARVLFRRDLLTMVTEAGDRRNKVLKLTPEGRRVLAAAAPIWEREHAAIEKLLGAGGATGLREGLNRLG